MIGRAHFLFLGAAAVATIAGAALWGRWGAAVWIADAAAWCA
jgi:hypothetical protein